MSPMARCHACEAGRICLKHDAGVVVAPPRPQDRDTVPPGQPCPTCEQTHPRCAAHNRQGGPCGQQPLKGQDVCRRHGGGSPQARAGAARRRLEEQARAALVRRWQDNGDQPITDPLGELARVAGEIVAFKDLLREQVQGLDGVLAYWQEKEYDDGDGGVAWTKAAEELRAVVAAYERAQERSAKILADMVKLDIAGRMLELRQTQADAIVTAVREGLSTVDLEHTLRSAALEAIAAKLEQITDHSTTPPRELMPHE